MFVSIADKDDNIHPLATTDCYCSIDEICDVSDCLPITSHCLHMTTSRAQRYFTDKRIFGGRDCLLQGSEFEEKVWRKDDNGDFVFNNCFKKYFSVRQLTCFNEESLVRMQALPPEKISI